MFLMIDNYDSFVYNLVRYFEELHQEVLVFRNDKIKIEEIRTQIEKNRIDGIIISPGPKTPHDSGICLDIIKEFAGKVPILGICLGHQVIDVAFGGRVKKGKAPVHGKISLVFHDGKGIYSGIKTPIKVTRYHSLVVDKSCLPNDLEITSETEHGVIMGIRHKKYLIEGVQFHPEAELTECGHKMLLNFIKMAKA